MRTSKGAFIDSRRTDKRLLGLEKRLSDLFMVDLHDQEPWNVLRYDQGQHYYAHYDVFLPDFFPKIKEDPGRQRRYTLLLYLSTPEEGGETAFPFESRIRSEDPGFTETTCAFGIKVRPRKGDVLYFESLYPDLSINSLTMHAGCPPSEGEKWIATKWISVGNFP